MSLLNLQLPPVKWAVDGLIPEGVSILAGRPKIGKSWIVLQTALAVAAGGYTLGAGPVKAGPVLYLALEDGRRRLQTRLKVMLDAQEAAPPPSLSLFTEWPRTSEGGLLFLEKWMAKNPTTRLIIIDTLARMRDKRQVRGNIYDEDYEAIALLQKLALQQGVAVLIVHHTRKDEESDDPLEVVSGTTGITGAADVVLVLKRQRHGKEGSLFITGRDVEEKEVQLEWNPQYCLWSISKNEDADKFLTANQRRVRQVLKAAGKAMSPLEIIPHLSPVKYNSLVQLLKRMAEDGLVSKLGHGLYIHPEHDHPSDDFDQNEK